MQQAPLINLWMLLPFVMLLALIAMAPVAFPRRWHRHYPKAAAILGGITLTYYSLSIHRLDRVGHTALEYLSFIILIGSLFVVAGGIHLVVKGEATPMVNTVFLLVGGILSNFLGTTGASMLLIRPWIRMNKYRVTGHHVVFFIFIVSNVGGALTPIGDPPLFLGYLKGVPFWWVLVNCWKMWLVGMLFLLAVFYFVDSHNFTRASRNVRAAQTCHETWKCGGLWNLAYLAVILGAVFIQAPPFLREGLMAAAALGSYFTTRKPVHAANDFNFQPLKEVAVLFFGIFATMMPALDWLSLHASQLGHLTPARMYWGSGLLSSVLDNAPTYLSFLSTLGGAFCDPHLTEQVRAIISNPNFDSSTLAPPQAEALKSTFTALHQQFGAGQLPRGLTDDQIRTAFLIGNGALSKFIAAISIGAVFFGANTYIGNGPNFMVKAIADQNKVHTPGFMEYVARYTLPVMLPMLVVIWWLFFR